MIRSITEILKSQAKSKGLTQSKLALELGVSLPTMKRWFSGKGLGLEEFLRLTQAIGLSFEDLAALTPEQEKKSFQYTELQETFFAEDPRYLAYFDQLLNGQHPDQIAARANLSPRSTRRYLKALEDIGLIEVHANHKVRLLVKGEPVWRKKGVLAQTLKAAAIEDFTEVASEKVQLMLHRYTPDDAQKIKALLQELSDAAATANRRAKFATHSQEYGLMLGVARYRWQLLESVEEL